MKILLADDARSVAVLLSSRLASFGHEICLAENGQVAFDKFQEFAPDLVLMDIEMPVMNGFDATHLIRAFEAAQKWAWTPIIFLTGASTTDNLVSAIEAGGDDLIAKNMPEAVLRAKMKAMTRVATLRQHLAAANFRLEELANRDGLTDLHNRRFMDQQTDVAWAEALAQHHSFAILMVDVDNFKKYNDHYGHQAGDDCLRSIAKVLGTTVKDSPIAQAFVARYGGEEFAVVLPRTSRVSYETLATQLVSAVRRCEIPHAQNAEWGVVTISIGGAYLAHAKGQLAPLFRASDRQLYLAKDHGRNRAELVDETDTPR
jgi:diguanylate cyclase (GGDEF)-like protein